MLKNVLSICLTKFLPFILFLIHSTEMRTLQAALDPVSSKTFSLHKPKTLNNAISEINVTLTQVDSDLKTRNGYLKSNLI